MSGFLLCACVYVCRFSFVVHFLLLHFSLFHTVSQESGSVVEVSDVGEFFSKTHFDTSNRRPHSLFATLHTRLCTLLKATCTVADRSVAARLASVAFALERSGSAVVSRCASCFCLLIDIQECDSHTCL